MREEIVKVYKYEELSEQAKEKAREKYKDTMRKNFHAENEMISEEFGEKLAELGYPNEDIRWSLASCQGDGVAFYGTLYGYDLPKVIDTLESLLSEKEKRQIKRLLKDDLVDVIVKISSNSRHYNHWNSMSVSLENFNLHKDYPRIEKLLNTLEEAIRSDVRKVSKRLESLGYKMIEEFFEDEAVAENIRSNDNEYREDGTVWRG